jgi:two-component sensor histidine kinase
VTILIPPDRHNEEPTILGRVRRGEHIEQYETVRQRKDGSLIEISLTVSPIKNSLGKIVGASSIGRDITERNQSAKQIATLAREVEHRAKNLLATVQATVHLSESDTPEGLKAAIEGRIMALASVNALFGQSRWTGADLYSLVTQELKPYRQGHEARVRIDGPHLILEPNTAQPIAMTVHELATNAAKYGALSVPEGCVEVTWSRSMGGTLVLWWTESGGPQVSRPTRQGFGTDLTQRAIEGLNGKIRFDWRAEGLTCEIVVPK